MARRSRREERVERDTTIIATPEFDRLLRPAIQSTPVNVFRPRDLRVVEDRRYFDPSASFGYSKGVMGTPARIVHGSALTAHKVQEGVKPVRIGVERFRYERPLEVVACIRRKTRREVLFAHKKTGKGAKAPRVRNLLSEVSCGR